MVWAYRILLGREPESPEAIARHLTACGSIEQLRNGFLASPEFREKNPLHPGFTPESTIVLAEPCDGLRVFVDLSDVSIGLNVARGVYEPHETAFIRSVVKPGDAVLDIGANIGFFTALMASLVGPEGHVVAFEPVPQNLALLRRTITENGFDERIRLLEAAVGEQAGEAHLIHLPLEAGALNSGGSYLRRAGDVPEKHEVVTAPQLKLDELDLPRPIRFIKIDIEGAEPLAFRGGRELLRADKPTILCEINPIQLERVSGTNAGAFLAEMQDLGYECVELADGRLGRTITKLDDALVNVVFR